MIESRPGPGMMSHHDIRKLIRKVMAGSGVPAPGASATRSLCGELAGRQGVRGNRIRGPFFSRPTQRAASRAGHANPPARRSRPPLPRARLGVAVGSAAVGAAMYYDPGAQSAAAQRNTLRGLRRRRRSSASAAAAAATAAASRCRLPVAGSRPPDPSARLKYYRVVKSDVLYLIK